MEPTGAFLTASMFTSFISDVTANAGVLIPIGLTIMAIMIGISLIPRIIYRFL